MMLVVILCVRLLLFSSDRIMFMTEPVFCSLANVLGNYENVPTPLPLCIKVCVCVCVYVRVCVRVCVYVCMYVCFCT